jgi:hypothetical protein
MRAKEAFFYPLSLSSLLAGGVLREPRPLLRGRPTRLEGFRAGSSEGGLARGHLRGRRRRDQVGLDLAFFALPLLFLA